MTMDASPFRQSVNDICETLPGAEWSDPWGGGHDAWKIAGKMFACMGSVDEGVSVKCADVEMAGMLIEAGVAVRAPYFHKSWVRLMPGAPADELTHRVTQSYGIVRGGLTKKLQATLPPWLPDGEAV
ncbi:MAG: MmcQ/YjbR family DNA-binding protein [Pseudomonadota bacterium]